LHKADLAASCPTTVLLDNERLFRPARTLGHRRRVVPTRRAGRRASTRAAPPGRWRLNVAAHLAGRDGLTAQPLRGIVTGRAVRRAVAHVAFVPQRPDVLATRRHQSADPGRPSRRAAVMPCARRPQSCRTPRGARRSASDRRRRRRGPKVHPQGSVNVAIRPIRPRPRVTSPAPYGGVDPGRRAESSLSHTQTFCAYLDFDGALGAPKARRTDLDRDLLWRTR
jgi:hypothetical protein